MWIHIFGDASVWEAHKEMLTMTHNSNSSGTSEITISQPLNTY